MFKLTMYTKTEAVTTYFDTEAESDRYVDQHIAEVVAFHIEEVTA